MAKRRGLEFVARDVAAVEKNARHLFEIFSGSIKYTNNPEGILNIIAVIGQGEFSGQRFERALLCEIGLGGKVPYQRLQILNEPDILRRRKVFSFDESQYRAASPAVFNLLQDLVNARAKKLNHLSRFVLSSRHWLSRRSKNPLVTEAVVSACKGIRFSVDCRDVFLLADLYWAVFRKYAQRVQWVAKTIYYTARNFRWDLNRNFRTSVEFLWIQEFLETKLPLRFLRIAALEALPGGKANPCFPYVAETLGWDGLPTKEQEICLSALSDSLPRVGKAEITIAPGLKEEERRRKLKARRYVIFRIFPSKDVVRERDATLLAEMYNTNQRGEGDLPF